MRKKQYNDTTECCIAFASSNVPTMPNPPYNWILNYISQDNPIVHTSITILTLHLNDFASISMSNTTNLQPAWLNNLNDVYLLLKYTSPPPPMSNSLTLKTLQTNLVLYMRSYTTVPPPALPYPITQKNPPILRPPALAIYTSWLATNTLCTLYSYGNAGSHNHDHP